ncbi:MAG TPA: GGDEF domain-containing phosphodiesterase [Stellaceae bacterium]|nr:GGDEF domain-containing phosphodiesterase [Stellaceae bacterium]
MIGKLDESLAWGARLIADIPAAVALFDRELRYVAASTEWSRAFSLLGPPLAGQMHDEFCAFGQAALRHAQLRALTGESIDDCPIAADSRQAAGGAVLSARPHRNQHGAVVGVVVALRPVDRSGPGGRRPTADNPVGLADRDELAARIADALADPDPAQGSALVIAISIDNLRAIKNLHGSAVVDRVWEIVADRLLSGTRARLVGEDGGPSPRRDLVGLLGAEQFGIVCAAPAPAPADAESLAHRLLRLVQSPIASEVQSLRLSASVGFLATTPAHNSAEEVLRDVDVALQRAQTLGPGKAVAWQPALTVAAARHYTLAEELRRGYDNGEFTLHYQPVLRLRDHRMVGAEVLLRWNHPSEGLAPAAAFIPVLEETGLIVEVGCWVIREAIRQLESWRLLYGRDIVEWLSVNLSARQLDNPVALLGTTRLIHQASFPVHRLRLEIGESVLRHNPAHRRALLDELTGLGIRLALDDFGAGPGALDSAHLYPVDTVKIDAGLIARTGSEEGRKLTQALLDVARAQGVAAIAKGVETAEQRDFMYNSGCGFGQGALFAEPMDAARLGAFALTQTGPAGRRHAARKPPLAPVAAMLTPTSAGR